MKNQKFTKEEIAEAAKRIRKRILGLTIDRGGCYLAQACSSAEIVTTMYMSILNLGPSLGDPDAQPFPGVPGPDNMDYPKGSLYNGYNYKDPDYSKDRFFVSCCHYASVIYCTLVEAGRMSERAIEKFNVDGWNMEMIGAEHSPGFENTAGSLGQTVSIAAGTAHAYKMKGHEGKIYCMLSDGELEEGQVWEAAMFAGAKKLDNLCVIVDNNNLQIDGPIDEVNSPYPIDKKFEAFNFHVINVADGHDFAQLAAAFAEARTIKGQPTAIICKTIKGKGVSFMENNAGWHGKAPNAEEYKIAMADLERIGEAL